MINYEISNIKHKHLTQALTTTGVFRLEDITLERAKELINENEILSAVGHQSTSDILTTLLETEVPVNRIQFAQENGQQALVFKLEGKPEEGKILTAEEIKEIGFKFQLLIKISD